jgi:hypothetical protein
MPRLRGRGGGLKRGLTGARNALQINNVAIRL